LLVPKASAVRSRALRYCADVWRGRSRQCAEIDFENVLGKRGRTPFVLGFWHAASCPPSIRRSPAPHYAAGQPSRGCFLQRRGSAGLLGVVVRVCQAASCRDHRLLLDDQPCPCGGGACRSRWVGEDVSPVAHAVRAADQSITRLEGASLAGTIFLLRARRALYLGGHPLRGTEPGSCRHGNQGRGLRMVQCARPLRLSTGPRTDNATAVAGSVDCSRRLVSLVVAAQLAGAHWNAAQPSRAGPAVWRAELHSEA